MGALEKLIPLAWEKLQEELKLASDAKQEFDDLKNLIGEIGYILDEAYSKEVIDKQLKPCIRRMRELFYDSEDAIEDFFRPVSSLRQLFNNRTFTVASREIRETLNVYAKNLGRTNPLKNFLGLHNNHAQSSSPGYMSSSKAFFDNADSLVGIQRPMKRLVQLLTENCSTSKVIFVHGAQGVGKTSLVAAVLRHQSVRRCFKYYVWIEGLRSCESGNSTEAWLLTARATMQKLTMEEGENHPGHIEPRKAFESIKEDDDLKANNFSWVLILDDVGRADVFPSVLHHLVGPRPSMLITTQVRTLKSSSENYLRSKYDPLDFEHVLLSENDSRTLFNREMEKTYKDHLLKSRTLEDASARILRRCKGLPLAILATCTLLKRNNQLGGARDADAIQLTDLSGRLEEEVLSNGLVVYPNGGKITLRTNYAVDIRACLFYLSMFPLDRPIRCNTMMRLWIAEGFIKQEEEERRILQKLLEHSVIWEKEYGRGKTGRVHNLLHQIIISRSKDEDLVMIVTDRSDIVPANVRYLSFHRDMDNRNHGTSVKQLRSLHVCGTVHQPSLKELLENAERLKVLHIQKHLTREEKKKPPASLYTFPRKILQSKYLRYLSLRGTNVENIPGDIGNLIYLETLDLKGTLVRKLRKGILKLTALRHLLVSRSNRSQAADTDLKLATDIDLMLGVNAPSKLGELTLLQKLCMIELKPVKWWRMQSKRVQLLEELGKLTDLQRLGLSMLESTDAELLCSSIEKLTNLVALRLVAAPGQKIDLSKKNMGQALRRLQRLHLTGCLGTLPKWVLDSDILVKLVLKRSQLTVNALQQLGNLVSLKHLELEQAFDVTDMKFEAEKFKELCILGLDRFDKLASIQVDKEALPTLERLSLARCNSLTGVPEFIIAHQKLKCLVLCDMPKKFDEAVHGNKEMSAHVEIKFKDWKKGGPEVVTEWGAESPSDARCQCKK